MKVNMAHVSALLTVFMIGLTAPAGAVDMNVMKQKIETVKGQTESVKKEGG